MSARVFNPLVMSEMRRMMGRSSSDGSGTTAAVARVRRDLFGPVNHEDAQAFVDKELATIRKRDTERWGFDFCREVPVEHTRFRWERVTPEENIPEAYALRRLSFLGQTQTPEPAEVKKDAPTNTSSFSIQKSTQSPNLSQKAKSPTSKQSQITDFMKCRKRSLSLGDISSRKVGSGPAHAHSQPSKSKRAKTQN